MNYNYVFIGYTMYYQNGLEPIKSLITINNDPSEHYSGIKKHLCRISFSSKLNNKFNVPGKSLWLKGITCSSFNSEKPICFLLHSCNILSNVKGLIPYIRKNYPQSKIVLHITDKVDFCKNKYGEKNFLNLIEQSDLVATYNYVDSKKYGFPVMPLVIAPFKYRSDDCDSDLLFVGQDKGRHQMIHKIYQKAIDRGLKCDFTILGVDESARLPRSNINYTKYLSYDEVCKKISTTKCVLNIPQDGAVGFTLRDGEAFSAGKYLMTPIDEQLKKYQIFCDKQLIHVDSEGNSDFDLIKTDPSFFSNDVSRYTWEARLNWVEKQLTNGGLNGGYFINNSSD